MSKVIEVLPESIKFDDGHALSSEHNASCCEQHWVSFGDLDVADFEGLEFDLSGDSFFERVPGYGIRLIPKNGHPVSVPGYAQNNGSYSDNLSLELKKRGEKTRCYDITECQGERGHDTR